ELTTVIEESGSYSKWIKIKYWWWNKGLGLVIVVLFLLANIGVVIHSVLKNVYTQQCELLGMGLLVAKGGAAVINLNAMLILLPVLSNVMTWLRGTWINNYIPIDRYISLHKLCASGLIIGSLAHCGAHFYNYYTLSSTPGEHLAEHGFPDYTPSTLFTSFPAITGFLMTLIMIVIVITSIESIRRPHFELFYYTHHLFIILFILLIFHGYTRQLKSEPTTYLWVTAPFVIYIVERAYRIVRGSRSVILHLAKQHPSKVLELRMKKDNFKFKPGQFIYLNCPSLTRNEWHPFTITSSPDESFISVHINIVGNWTGRLYKLLNPNEKLGIVQNEVMTGPDNSPILKIQGPFGAASEDVFKYKVVMLVGAGIGATPFASILKHIKYRLVQSLDEQRQKGNNTYLPIQKVYFFWISREKNSFEWFTFILHDVETELNDLVEIHTYLTGAIEVSDWNAIVEGLATIDSESHTDFITGLKSQTMFGRPNWSGIFQEVVRLHKESSIGVFFCGPRPMAKEIRSNCHRFNGMEGCNLHFYKENF
ncbi:hypothetical protein SAMD00019534_117140, partial [Acytostelium subglobosum LB1]|uniref:hypothetical protein n=1 Tax=Acytostelium subglobosum LB1 TaxID=1410327 RepID=UPI000645127E